MKNTIKWSKNWSKSSLEKLQKSNTYINNELKEPINVITLSPYELSETSIRINEINNFSYNDFTKDILTRNINLLFRNMVNKYL